MVIEMLNKLMLRDVGPSRELTLDLGSRLNVFTGDNGLGKSFVLDIAWWVLTGMWPDKPAWPHRRKNTQPSIAFEQTGREGPFGGGAPYSFNEQRWKLEVYGRPDPGLMIYARTDGSFLIWDPARRHKGDSSYRAPGLDMTAQQIWDGFKIDDRVLCKGLIEDWVLWQKASEPAFGQLCDVLRSLSPDENEILEPGKPSRVWIQDVRDIPTLKTPYGDIPVTLASAGVQRIIALAYVLVWTWQEHLRASELLDQPAETRITFLIDEIEAHLHPKWQRTLLPSLLPLAEALLSRSETRATCQIITTTHSPLVMTSLEPIFDPESDCVFVFDLVGSDVEVSKNLWRPRGDASAWLTSEVFALGQDRSVPAEKAIADSRCRTPSIASVSTIGNAATLEANTTTPTSSGT